MRIHRWLIVLVAVAAWSLPAFADKGSAEYKQGARAESQMNYDSACAHYKQATTLSPNNPQYFSAYARVRFEASMRHVHTGQLLLNTGALTDALAEFQHASELDTSSFIAQQEMRRTADMLRKQERQRSLPPAQAPSGKLPEGVGESLELHALSDAAISLHMSATSTDVVYRTIGKLAGLNVLIDPEYRPQKFSFDLTDVTLREALDLVRLQSKTFWKPVSANTIFVTADTSSKRKELEQNVMKTFYLRNITTANELQEAANMVRQILDVSRVQLMQAQDALILRGTPDQMVLAEKLLADYDKPKAEVIIDVTVMQVGRDRLRNLGTTVPTSFSSGSSSGGRGYTVGIGNFAISIPGGSFTMLASASDSKILQNPEIRALNDEKATLRIGDRVPIATGSFSTGVVGAGSVSPLVSTQFQYLDVGVNIDITPHIHSDREVTLKMVLEISSVTGSETIGGITQPIIGQRRIEHETRLADGEVNLLAGMLEDTETKSLSGYPWVNKIPILKYLFAQENKDHQENEIVFAITPHIVRAKEVTEENQRMIEIGTGSSIELRRKPHSNDTAKALPPDKASAPGAPVTAPASTVPVQTNPANPDPAK
jgi:general secretion pathway protein D